MDNTTEIENIEEMRRCQGIDDVELHEGICQLRSGDVVRLTFVNRDKPSARETLSVRITSRSGEAFHGKLADTPMQALQSRLHAGSRIAFAATHIHSIRKEQPAHDA